MLNRPDVESALQRALAYLQSQQQSDGSFLSYSSLSARRFKIQATWHTTFGPALILTALSTINAPEALAIRQRLANFLSHQRGTAGSFNYWAKDAPQRQALPYPDDLDDTFCALIALQTHDAALIDERVLAQSVKLLLATETKVGGPYRTWLVSSNSKPDWLDIDLAVNANIAYFLQLTGSSLPNLEDFMSQAITSRQLVSPYYPSACPLVYYLSRAYEGPRRPQLLTIVRRLQRATELTALDNALYVIARLQLGETQSLEAVIRKLLGQQAKDGSWPAAAFCIDPATKGRPQYGGSASLTTAIVCEALQRFLQHKLEVPRQQRPSRQESLALELLEVAKTDCRHLAPAFRTTFLDRLSRLSRGPEGEEIIGLPQAFQASLRQPPRRVPAHFLRTLSLANLYGWLAYTIYDDFLDDNGHPQLLSVANVALRKSVNCFSESLPFHRPFQVLTRTVFDTIDEANFWEIRHCRFKCADGVITLGGLPDYGDLTVLAQRSLGHLLPLLAILLASGIDDTSADFTGVRQALTHYLVARQLNDDIHDWEEDLSRGHITYVVVRLLAATNTAAGSAPLTDLTAILRKYFWYSGLPELCRDLRRHTAIARQCLESVTALQPANCIDQLLTSVETSVDTTLAKHQEAHNFLQHYCQGT